MVLNDLIALVEGRIVCGEHRAQEEVDYAFASDLMSDVLTLRNKDFVLLTGLTNIQLIRTAEMSDLNYILLCRRKKANEEMLELARENGIMIIESPMSLFKACGVLYGAGIKPIF